MSKQLSKTELHILSYYRACELAGSVLFGRLALHTEIDSIRTNMTHHCLEEAEHAWLWNKTIEILGETPMKVTQTYQTEYGKAYGMPTSIIEIFALTQIFELRTTFHFQRHLDMPSIHPEVARTLQKMIDDEAGHLGWIKKELDAYPDQKKVTKIMDKMKKLDQKIYNDIMNQTPYKEFFAGA